MKKIVFVIVLFSLLLSACTGGGNVSEQLSLAFTGRDLSTPSSRLVGHWKSQTISGNEKFFSEIDQETGEGTYTDYDPGNGAVTVMTYKIDKTSDSGKLTILATTSDGTELSPMEIITYEDGKSAMIVDSYFSYMNDKTEFDSSDIKPTKQQPTQTPAYGIYKVNKSTGLYESADADSDMRMALPEGYLLKPRNGESEPDCKDVNAGYGMIIHLCYMESISTGQAGWVIKKWMTKIHQLLSACYYESI